MYPFMSTLYIFVPKSGIGRFMGRPFIKFICHSAAYMYFLCKSMFLQQIHIRFILSTFNNHINNKKKKGMVLYSAVSSPLDRSKRFTLSSPGRPVHSDTVLGFSWKHSSHAAIAQRLFTHISTTVYSQVLIYTAESTEAS